jgi:hypothetical protein
MKTSLVVCALLSVTGQLAWTVSAAEGQTKAPETVVIPRSVFEASTQYLDPFHPGSTRRVGAIRVDEGDQKTSDTDLASLLILNGLSGSAAQRLAIINGKTFAAGEQGDVLTQRGKVKVHCLEIRPTSIVIAIGAEGSKAELKLKD